MMKRSTQVLLTLMLPAVAAFGCESAKKPQVAKPANCSGPAKPGEPPKTEFCDPATAQTHTNGTTAHHTARTGSYLPWLWFWGAGNRSMGNNAGFQSGPNHSAGPMTPTSGNPAMAPTSRPAGAPASVTSGGFGRTGGGFSSSS